MAFVRMNFLDLDWAEYNDKQGFVGSNEGLIAVLKFAHQNVGPQDGDGFAAMAHWLKRQNLAGIEITYKMVNFPGNEDSTELPSIIY